MVLSKTASPAPNLILWNPIIKLLIWINRLSFYRAVTWGFPAIETPEAPISSIILWKVISEYQVSRMKKKTGVLFCLLKGSNFVIA
jgi:hypothetical protein